MTGLGRRVAFVDTGHTHYNELLNDGRVIYGATRSTGEIEEGGGKPGHAIVTVRDSVPSWRFKETGGDWPCVQIIIPAISGWSRPGPALGKGHARK